MIMYPSSPVEFDSLIFEDAPWELYEAFLKSYDEAPSRISYDRGKMEVVMMLSAEHEGYRAFLGAMLECIFAARRTRVARRGSTTLKQQELARGLEADHCYWIANAAAVRGVRRIDLTIHPPPDLVIEVDVTHSAVDRESIYTALGVPEMWQYARQTGLTAWANKNGRWDRIDASVSIPGLPVNELNPFLTRFAADEDENDILDDLRAWLAALP